MSELTLTLSDEKSERLSQIAKARSVSVDDLISEMVTLMIADLDAEARFKSRAQRGMGREERGRQLLSKALGDGPVS
jgi:predicted transcriptional regulator